MSDDKRAGGTPRTDVCYKCGRPFDYMEQITWADVAPAAAQQMTPRPTYPHHAACAPSLLAWQHGDSGLTGSISKELLAAQSALPQAQVAADSREAFEEWANAQEFRLDRYSEAAGDMASEHIDPMVRLAWAAWQAAPQSAVAQENGIPAEVLAALREARKLLSFVNYRPDTPAIQRIDALLTKYSGA